MPDTINSIRLRPKTPAQKLRFGYPWVYSDQLVLDRRTRSIDPGDIVELLDNDKKFLGIGAFNPNSRIAFRMLERAAGVPVDLAWITARLERALAHRDHLFDAPFYRLIHAEADGLPGVIIDRFGDVAVIQPNAAWADARAEMFAEALQSLGGIRHVWLNASGRTRKAEGLGDVSRCLAGDAPDVVDVPMNGAIYQADLAGGQKTGLFYDQRPNHAMAATLSKGLEMLDVFSHVGGFALAGLAGGAVRATAVDASAAALELARAGAEKSGFGARFETRQGDAFAHLDALGEEGAKFGLVVCDPPAFAPQKQALEAGLRAYERVARKAAPLVSAGGYLVLCSCSHAVDLARFREVSLRGVSKAGRLCQIIHTGTAGADHPVHPALAESDYLKSLFLRML